MRKTSEGLQVQTALEKAEQRLEEAIRLARKEAEKQENEKKAAMGAIKGAMAEFKKESEKSQSSDVSRDGDESDQSKSKGVKQLYGFAPELSRSEAIEVDVESISEEKKELLKSILGENDYFDEVRNEVNDKVHDKVHDEEHKRDDNFHDVLESFDDNKSKERVLELYQEPYGGMDLNQLIRQSEEYLIKSFDESNILADEEPETDIESEDIMPSNFSLYSFDDEEEEEITPYDINEALILGEPVTNEQLDDINGSAAIQEDSENEAAVMAEVISNPEETDMAKADEKYKKIIEKAEKEAADILNEANRQAEELRKKIAEEGRIQIEKQAETAEKTAAEKGYAEGFEKGKNDGYMETKDAVNQAMINEAAEFRNILEESLNDFERRKEELLNNSINELTNLAVDIAEKVIKISLKSSKDVVAKMIVAAAEDCRNKAWAKIFISHEDKAITFNLEKNLMDALKQISENIKVVIMEDEPSGTCIIESPDQIVDASVGVQLENIRQIVNDNEL